MSRPTLLSGFEDIIKYITGLEDHVIELEEEITKLHLRDVLAWENHPALRHKVVLDDDFYLQHLYEGELVDPDEFGSVVEENKKLKNDLRLCADGLIPDGMVGGIVQTEREKRHNDFDSCTHRM